MKIGKKNELSTDLSNTPRRRNRWNNGPANPNQWQVDDKYQDFLTFLIEGKWHFNILL